jgi:hypothetical protein
VDIISADDVYGVEKPRDKQLDGMSREKGGIPITLKISSGEDG